MLLILAPTLLSAQSFTSKNAVQGNKWFKGFVQFAKEVFVKDTMHIDKGVVYADGTVGTTGFTSGDTVQLNTLVVTRDSLYIGSDGYLHFVSGDYDIRLTKQDSTKLPSPLTEDLLVYWNFDQTTGNLLDQVGDWDGVVSGATQNAAGKVGNGFSFDGIDDVVTITFDSAMNLQPPFTISSWIYQTASDADPILARNPGNGNVVPYIYEISYGFLRLRYFDPDQVSLSDDEQVTIENWYHFVITVDTSETKIYLNNTLVMTTTGVSALPINYTNLFIGAYPDGSAYFAGVIDEVGIWTRVLSATDVSTLNNSGNGKTYPF